MEPVISVSLGEVILKGKNRKYFIQRLMRQLKAVIQDIGYNKMYQEMGKIYIEVAREDMEQTIQRVRNVFGIVYVSPCIRVEKDMESLEEGAKWIVKEYLQKHRDVKTFKVQTIRGDKHYPLKSPEISRKLGGTILSEIESLHVDVHDPDIYVYCDVKVHAYLYIERIKAFGGLPLGTNEKGLLLLSGGIDSPVAGFLMAKRGVQIDAVHYHSYPFTSERAENKVIELAEILSRYVGPMRIHSVNILPIQKEINQKCPQEEMTIISRRFMMRIADKLSKMENYMSVITGESLGQVASQTIHGITVTNHITDTLVFRPLIAMDKVDIIKWAEEIGTYETSIQPFEDCCTVFLPKHPVLRPTVETISESEEALEIEALVDDAINNRRIISIP